jgi:hypothetical protein
LGFEHAGGSGSILTLAAAAALLIVVKVIMVRKSIADPNAKRPAAHVLLLGYSAREKPIFQQQNLRPGG